MSTGTQVRSYLKARLSELDPDLTEWPEPFDKDNLPESILDSTYQISMSNVSITLPSDISVNHSLTAEVHLFRRGYKEVIEEHDSLLDFATCFSLYCADPERTALTDNIRLCAASAISLEPYQVDNDNIVRCIVSFEINLWYGIKDIIVT